MTIRLGLATTILAVAALAAEPGGEARYLGGTVRSLATNTIGNVQTDNAELFVFASQKSTIRISYRTII